VENTVKIEYFAEEKPNNKEIINFLKEIEVNLNGILGFYGSETEKAFFVKFAERNELNKFCDYINTRNMNMIIRKHVHDVKATIMDSFLTDVYIYGLPFEVSDEIVVKKLSRYGKVVKIIWNKCNIKDDVEIYDGIRIITMEIRNVIPPYVYILDVKTRAYFKYQKDMCYRCMSIAHYRNKCNIQSTMKMNKEVIRNQVNNLSTVVFDKDDNLSSKFEEVKQGNLSFKKHEESDDDCKFEMV